MNQVLTLTILICIIISNNALAAWEPAVEVVALRTTPDSDALYVKLSKGASASECTSSKLQGRYVVTDAKGRLFSMLLAAKAANQKVMVNTVGCTNSNMGKIVEIQFGEVDWYLSY